MRQRTYFREPYKAPSGPLPDGNRADYMANLFAQMHGDICADKPDMVYFAGRGSDLKYFLAALADGGACGLDKLDVYTGDDVASLVGDNDLALPADGSVRVFYTALAHRDQWRGPRYPSETGNYDAFAKAFTDNGFAADDLADGFAIVEHDAVFTAAIAVRKARDESGVNPIAPFIMGLHCQGAVPGASGYLAFRDGNPIDKAMPVLQIRRDGSATQEDLAWSDGTPFDTRATC